MPEELKKVRDDFLHTLGRPEKTYIRNQLSFSC